MAIQSVRDLMTPNPQCCTPQDSIPEVARMMVECDCGIIPVVENRQNGRLVGVVTDRDIVCRVIARDLDPSGATVNQAMTEDVQSLGTDASLDDCVRLMSEFQVRRIPIVENDRIVGMVAQADLARASASEQDMEDELAEVVEEVSEAG
jgi:CBS domain-containing protein